MPKYEMGKARALVARFEAQELKVGKVTREAASKSNVLLPATPHFSPPRTFLPI